MTTVLEKAPALKKTPVQQDAKVIGKDDALIEEAIAKVRSYRSQIGNNAAKCVLCLCRIGAEFKKLKTQIPHGEWQKTVKEQLGYNEDTVCRLINLADSWLEEQITTLGRDLKARLATDVQKLVTLTRLPKEKFVDILTRYDLSDVSREQLREVVDEMLEESESKDGNSQKGRSKSSKRRKTQAEQSNTSPIEQLFAICEQPMSDLTASVQKQLAGGDVYQEL